MVALITRAYVNVAGETWLNESHENAGERKCNSAPLIIVHWAIIVAPLNFVLQFGEYDQILDK